MRLLDVAERLLDEGYGVRFRAHGTSMQPAIADGDTITVARVEPAGVRRGDILLYRYQQRPIAHRVVDIQMAEGEIAAFVVRGDAKAGCDAPVAPSQVVGKVVAIDRRSWRVAAQLCLARLVHRARTAGRRRHPDSGGAGDDRPGKSGGLFSGPEEIGKPFEHGLGHSLEGALTIAEPEHELLGLPSPRQTGPVAGQHRQQALVGERKSQGG